MDEEKRYQAVDSLLEEIIAAEQKMYDILKNYSESEKKEIAEYIDNRHKCAGTKFVVQTINRDIGFQILYEEAKAANVDAYCCHHHCDLKLCAKEHDL